MKWITEKKLRILGLPLLFSVMAIKGVAAENLPLENSPVQSPAPAEVNTETALFNDLDFEFLTAEVYEDTENMFEAVFFDHQSQETIGRLHWDRLNKEGTIVFDYAGVRGQTDLQIENIDALALSERHEVLLRGLHEAGIAWLTQYRNAPLVNTSERSLQTQPLQIVAAGTHRPYGYLDRVQPDQIINRGNRNQPGNRSRQLYGWSYDPDRPNQSTWVHIYGSIYHFGAPNGRQHYIGAVYANQRRPDVNRVMRISGNHGFQYTVPEVWDADHVSDKRGMCDLRPLNDGSTIDLCGAYYRAYGIDLTGNANRQLLNRARPALYACRYRPGNNPNQCLDM
jgi:hypothetical protein